jgi:cbb3-type cytochrome oxidase subunit 3
MLWKRAVVVALLGVTSSYGRAGAESGEATSGYQALRSTPAQSERREHFIRRIYGPENAKVRSAVRQLEESMGGRWQTGLPNPDHVVPYKNHHWDPKTRTLEVDTEGSFQPMRIHFDTSALDQRRSMANGARIDFVKNEILPRTGDFWSKALSVVPVSGNLKIDRNGLSNGYCGHSEFSLVPDNHITNGLPDVDLIIYVSGTPSAMFCGSNTLAVAVACNQDHFDRPTAGSINFCLEQITLGSDGTASDSIKQDNVDVAVHETAHVLGMSSNSFKFFRDHETGKPLTPRRLFEATTVTCVDGKQRVVQLPAENTLKLFTAKNGQRYASIVTPKVATVARNIFNCQTLEGAQLENQPTGDESCYGDHWDERLYYPEAMSGVISPHTNVLSPLTLALFEDSGWYKANYTMASSSPWGMNATCDFVTDPCVVEAANGATTIPDYGRGYFCNRPSARGCSPTHTHKASCSMMDHSMSFPPTNIPARFQYFSDPNVGGSVQTDFCPVYGSNYEQKTAEQLACNGGTPDFVNIYSEEYGENSICVESSSGEGKCHIHACVRDEMVVKIQFMGEWHKCNYDFEEIKIKLTGGAISSTLICPRLTAVCPDMICPFNCAGRGICNYEHVQNGTRAPRCECFDATDTSPACSSSLIPDGKWLEDSSGLLDNLQSSFLDPLVAVFVSHPDDWETASYAWCAGLLVIFLAMICCICSSCWPGKKEQYDRRSRY